MCVKKSPFAAALMAFVLSLPIPAGVQKREREQEKNAASTRVVLWRSPSDIASRDLFYGEGGKEHAPRGPYFFVKEDSSGTNPKFVVRDGNGIKWKVKLGIEARPETAASRIVWAAGYYVDEDYLMQDMQVRGMPAHLHRGQELIGPGGSVHDARLKREGSGYKKVGTWKWRKDPFTGTRELNGLKVMMALINNWDLKDVNNAVYQRGSERIYLVSDLGASFGTSGRSLPTGKAKGNLGSYSHSKFIRETSPGFVDFQAPARPTWILLVNPTGYIRRVHLEWIGKNIPRADAKWIGQLLARLSPRQIRDAFRGAGYSLGDVEGFSEVLESRIAALTDL